MEKAVLYLRVSGDGQIGGDGFPRQRAACEKYALANGLEIIDEYRDEGISGKTELEKRSGLAACLERVENNGVKLVLVESADRLARDAMVAEIIIREFQKAGVTVIACSGGVNLTQGDDSNPTAKLVRQILASIAEFDRCVIVLKLRAARDRQKAKGLRCEGVKPFGHFPGEQSTLETIHKLRAENHTLQFIADYLNDNQIPTRSGSAPWRPGVIAKILARKHAEI